MRYFVVSELGVMHKSREYFISKEVELEDH